MGNIMNIRMIHFIAVAMTAALCVGCDAHIEEEDISMKVGHVLCTDGKTLPLEACRNMGKDPIAVVFYVNAGSDDRITGKGYAVYLWDIAPEAFADSLGVSQKTSADTEAFDGNTNTYALYDTKETASPMAEAVFDLWRYGQSAYIGSVAEMRLLNGVRESVNSTIEKCGGQSIPIGDDACWYWTSTEVNGQQMAKAWLYSMGSGAIQETPKTQVHRVRPIITINN